MSEEAQRRLSAIVSADVVGYSRLMGVDEAGTLTLELMGHPAGTEYHHPEVLVESP